MNEFREKLGNEKYLTFNPGLFIGGTEMQYDSASQSGNASGKTNIISPKTVVIGDLRSLSEQQKEKAREAIRDRFEKQLGATPAAGILVALAVGDQRSISAEEWRLFNRTGVTHLMSISGLHVTLVSGLAAWLVAFGWRRVPYLALRFPARKSAALAAIFGALGYTLLAGFAVPAQRTFDMVSGVALAL